MEYLYTENGCVYNVHGNNLYIFIGEDYKPNAQNLVINQSHTKTSKGWVWNTTKTYNFESVTFYNESAYKYDVFTALEDNGHVEQGYTSKINVSDIQIGTLEVNGNFSSVVFAKNIVGTNIIKDRGANNFIINCGNSDFQVNGFEAMTPDNHNKTSTITLLDCKKFTLENVVAPIKINAVPLENDILYIHIKDSAISSIVATSSNITGENMKADSVSLSNGISHFMLSNINDIKIDKNEELTFKESNISHLFANEAVCKIENNSKIGESFFEKTNFTALNSVFTEKCVANDGPIFIAKYSQFNDINFSSQKISSVENCNFNKEIRILNCPEVYFLKSTFNDAITVLNDTTVYFTQSIFNSDIFISDRSTGNFMGSTLHKNLYAASQTTLKFKSDGSVSATQAVGDIVLTNHSQLIETNPGALKFNKSLFLKDFSTAKIGDSLYSVAEKPKVFSLAEIFKK